MSIFFAAGMRYLCNLLVFSFLVLQFPDNPFQWISPDSFCLEPPGKVAAGPTCVQDPRIRQTRKKAQKKGSSEPLLLLYLYFAFLFQRLLFDSSTKLFGFFDYPNHFLFREMTLVLPIVPGFSLTFEWFSSCNWLNKIRTIDCCPFSN